MDLDKWPTSKNKIKLITGWNWLPPCGVLIPIVTGHSAQDHRWPCWYRLVQFASRGMDMLANNVQRAIKGEGTEHWLNQNWLHSTKSWGTSFCEGANEIKFFIIVLCSTSIERHGLLECCGISFRQSTHCMPSLRPYTLMSSSQKLALLKTSIKNQLENQLQQNSF